MDGAATRHLSHNAGFKPPEVYLPESAMASTRHTVQPRMTPIAEGDAFAERFAESSGEAASSSQKNQRCNKSHNGKPYWEAHVYASSSCSFQRFASCLVSMWYSSIARMIAATDGLRSAISSRASSMSCMS